MRRALALAASVSLSFGALAHSVSVDSILQILNAPASKEELGVVRATRDPKLPRLLVVEVAGRWHRLGPEVRREKAGGWLKLWRHTVPQGIVAVLDAVSGEPVVEFRPGDVVVVVPAK